LIKGREIAGSLRSANKTEVLKGRSGVGWEDPLEVDTAWGVKSPIGRLEVIVEFHEVRKVVRAVTFPNFRSNEKELLERVREGIEMNVGVCLDFENGECRAKIAKIRCDRSPVISLVFTAEIEIANNLSEMGDVFGDCSKDRRTYNSPTCLSTQALLQIRIPK
jgi:hypothetical protein